MTFLYSLICLCHPWPSTSCIGRLSGKLPWKERFSGKKVKLRYDINMKNSQTKTVYKNRTYCMIEILK